ncbi:MAG: hypothetical protein ACRERX_13065, partial [Pseudomonas sp.]
MTINEKHQEKNHALVPVPGLPEPATRAGWRNARVRKNMQRALSDSGLARQAEIAFRWWPTLQNTAVALCAHVGDRILNEEGIALAHATVLQAVRAFNESTN